jgi:hypothetical protein
MLYSGLVGTNYFKTIDALLNAAKSDAELFEIIVNAPFHDKVQTTSIDLGIIVLLLVNKAAGTIDRIALSNTEPAAGAVKMSQIPFKEIKVPVGYKNNVVAKAIATGKRQCVTDWKYLFVPGLSPRAARLNQAGAGIEFSCVQPLKARDGGALIFSFFQETRNISQAHFDFTESYAKLAEKALNRP